MRDFRRPADWFGGGSEAVEALTRLREDLHRRPELSWKEARTTERLADFLSSQGITEVQRLSPTGLVARVPGRGDGPPVAIRGDIDALPIQETTDLPFASQEAGVMHACGHDVHATWAVGAALLLAREPAPADVLVVLQPAEETGEGASMVLESGLLGGVRAIFGGHVDPRWTVGELVAQEGPVAAATDEFVVTLRGAGGHGARPHLGRDPIVAAASLVTDLQTLVSRRVTPGEPAVATVGRIEGGSAANVIPDEVRLEGTLRSVTPGTRESLRFWLVELAQGCARTHQVEAAVQFRGGTPPLVNDPRATELARRSAEAVVGGEGLQAMEESNMGGEDFAVYLERIPGCFLRIGSRWAEDEVIGAHTGRFLPRTECVFVGAEVLAGAARLACEGGRL